MIAADQLSALFVVVFVDARPNNEARERRNHGLLQDPNLPADFAPVVFLSCSPTYFSIVP